MKCACSLMVAGYCMFSNLHVPQRVKCLKLTAISVYKNVLIFILHQFSMPEIIISFSLYHHTIIIFFFILLTFYSSIKTVLASTDCLHLQTPQFLQLFIQYCFLEQNFQYLETDFVKNFFYLTYNGFICSRCPLINIKNANFLQLFRNT